MNNATQSFLGRYRLVKVLGQGAMGVVYEAVDSRLGRTVAIKTVLRSHLADESSAGEYASRFEREAQAAARLAHPNIVTVHDFGEHEDISYIVMEFVRGQELAKVFEAGQALPLAQTLRIMGELLAALDFAHGQGIVHRDVKPANVMLDHAGHVKLTDFGVARVANTTQDRTMPGTLVGTPSYMAPEQVLGLAVGSRADIFAAGVILYQCLTGQRPFTGAGPFAVQRQIVQDDPPPPSRVVPHLPDAFDRVIARALAKQPEDRYPTAATFAQALARIEGAQARDASAVEADGGDSAPRGAAARSAAPTPRATPTAAPAAPPTAAPAAGPASARQAPSTHALRRTVLPLLAGALVALLALAAWILFVDATHEPPATSAAPGIAAGRPAGADSGARTAPAPASAAPPPPPAAPVTAPPTEPSAAAEPSAAPAAAPAAEPPAAPAATTPPTGPRMIPEPAPPARPRAEHRVRPKVDAPAPEAAEPDRQERREVLGARCSDLLQRMQIGEPLTPEQSKYFQSRCTR